MPLDPQARRLIEELAAAPVPRLQDSQLDETRARLQAAARVLATGGDEVAGVSDLTVTSRGGPLAVRAYRPPGRPPFPVVMAFHGGGFVIGSIEEHEGVARALARRAGALVLSVGYHLAPEHRFPTALEDCYAATCWAAEHAGELEGDGARLAVSGDSAGANLAAAVTLLARDRGGLPLSFQLLTCPLLDATMASPSIRTYGEGYLLPASGLVWFWRQYLGDGADPASPYVSPLLAPDLRGLPPARIITAECDPLRDEGEAYAERLREAGVRVVRSRYQGMVHGFVGLGMFLRQGTIALEEAGFALRQALALALP